MHTVEQAKELWCPMARVAMAHKDEGETDYTMDAAVYNRVAIKSKPTTIPRSCNCMADKCAMWRFHGEQPTHRVINADVFNSNAPGAANFEFVAADDAEGEPDRYIESVASVALRKRGYCGLSPIPQVAP